MEIKKVEMYFEKLRKTEELKRLKEEEVKRATSEKLFFQHFKEKRIEQVI